MSGIRNNQSRPAATDLSKLMLVALVSVLKFEELQRTYGRSHMVWQPRRQSNWSLFLFFLLLLPLNFCLSANPPISEMLSQNLEQGNLLVGAISSGETVSINLKLVKITPSIEGSISAEEQNYLLYSSSISLYAKDTFLDPDSGCGKRLVNASIELNFIFTINNQSKSVSYSLTDSEALPTNILVPFSENELSLADANDSLKTLLEWSVIARYNDYSVSEQVDGNGNTIKECSFAGTKSDSFSGTSNISYKLEGGNLLFFLSKPVLKEQWHKNNHFDSVILSKRRFYKGEIFKNEEQLHSAQLYLFDTSYDQYGLLDIILVKNISNELLLSEVIAYNFPVPLESTNESFSYVYMFNSTYEGIGKNNLTVKLYDTFGNEFTQTYEITSKMIGFGGNNSEEGVADEYTRKSASFGTEELVLILVPTSIIGILFIIVFFRFKK